MTVARTTRTIAYVHLHRPSDEVYRQVFTVLADITPVVQALPPDNALLDLTGSLRYFARPPADLALLLQVKVLARFGVQATVGIGPNRMLATLAAQTTGPATAHVLPDNPQQIAAFLGPFPLQVLPGVGLRTSHGLAKYGLTTVADLRTVPVATLQRITTTKTGRLLAERAHGRDPRTVHPGGPPSALAVRRAFAHDTVDPDAVHRALLSAALELGSHLRGSAQVTGHLELEVRYADHSTTTRARTLREPTNHTPALQDALYQVFASLNLQRARLRTLTVRAGRITAAEHSSIQLTLHRPTEHARTLEPTIDRANRRFGPEALYPAALAAPRRPTVPNG